MTILALLSTLLVQVSKEVSLQGPVSAVAFAPSPPWMAAASQRVVMINTKSWEQILLGSHGQRVGALLFSANGKILVSGGWDRTIKFWDTETNGEICCLEGHPDGLSALAFSPDGAQLASADWSGTVKVWDVATRTERISVKGHSRGIGSLAWSKSGKLLFSAGWDGIVKTYKIGRTVEAMAETPLGIPGVHFIEFSHDGSRVLTGAGDRQMVELKVFDASSGRELKALRTHRAMLRRGIFTRDGTRIVSAELQEPCLRIWNADSGGCVKELHMASGPGGAHSLAASAAGDLGAVGTDAGKVIFFPLR
jgi:WD40 repeat protein